MATSTKTMATQRARRSMPQGIDQRRVCAWPGAARAATAAVGAVLLLTAAVLAGAATSKRSYRRTRLAVPGGIALTH